MWRDLFGVALWLLLPWMFMLFTLQTVFTGKRHNLPDSAGKSVKWRRGGFYECCLWKIHGNRMTAFSCSERLTNRSADRCHGNGRTDFVEETRTDLLSLQDEILVFF